MDGGSDPNRTCIRAVLGQFPPYSYVYTVGEEIVTRGIIVELLYIIVKHFNLCLEFTPNMVYGGKLPNGTYTGIMKGFLMDEYDVSATVFALTNDRASVVDHKVLAIESHSLTYRAPQIEPDLLGFIKPFTLTAWLVIFGALLLMMALLRAFNHTYNKLSAGEMRVANATLAAMTTLRTLLGQALSRSSISMDRGLLCTWMLASFILGTIYKSNLKAMLIIPRLERPFDSLEELLETNIPLHSIIQSVFHHESMKAPPGSLLGRAFLRAEFKAQKGLQDVIHDLKIGKYALVAYSISNQWAVHSEFSRTRECKLMESRIKFMPQVAAVLVNKKLRKKELMFQALTRLQESGIVQKLMEDETGEAQRCNEIASQQTNMMRALTIEDFIGVFLFYVGGIVLSVVAFVFEVFLHRAPRNQRTSTSGAPKG